MELRLLFQNLISNAIQYSRPGEPPSIEVRAQREALGWKLCVPDRGICIPKEKCEQVFRIFRRPHSSDEFEGAGIGLAHCAKIVHIHGGRIWIEDGPKGETCVSFWSTDLRESSGIRSLAARFTRDRGSTEAPDRARR